MEKENRNNAYLSINSIKDLQYHRRLLSSRIEHQEIVVMYKLRGLWDNISPLRLLNMGCEAIASHNPMFNIIFKSFTIIKSFLLRNK